MAHKILIVDDDAATREMVVRLLTYEGYEAVTATDVPAAMHVLAERKPDLLITDVRLDTYNGLHLIAMAPTPIPAIVLTGFADPAIEADARRLGAEYLVKPVSPATLCAVIARTLANAEKHGVFLSARGWPRTPVTTPIPLVVGDLPAQLVDVSDGGARLQVRCVVGTGLPAAFTIVFSAVTLDVAVDVAWKRRQDDTTWVCGVAVRDDAQPQWRVILKSLTESD
jgi:DNA-binding response OmpR family regulator